MTTKTITTPARFGARIWREAYSRPAEEGEADQTTKEYPAEWAVYQVETGVRMAYAKSEEGAKLAAEKWNAGKMPEVISAKADSAVTLRKLLKPGDEVKTILRKVSSSSMSRRISLIVARDNEVIDITWNAARVMEDKVKQGGKYVQDAGMVVSGCGMDMGFHIVYNLGRYLFPDGFGEIGTHNHQMNQRPTSEAAAIDLVKRGYKFNGRNGDTSGWDNDGGYALKQRWL